MLFYSFCPEFLNPTDPGTPISPFDYVLTFLLLHGFSPEAINRVVPGGWSIGVEWTFYLCFPLFFYLATSLRRALVGVVAVTLAGHLLFSMAHSLLWHQLSKVGRGEFDSFVVMSFITQAPVFLVGFATYFYLRGAPDYLTRDRFKSSCLLAFSLALYILVQTWKHPFIPLVPLMAVLMALMIIALSREAVPYIVNPILCYVGKISFSCYLVHFAALGLTLQLLGYASNMDVKDPGTAAQNFWLFSKIFGLSLSLTIAGASLTYYLIEKPGIGLGQKCVRWLNGSVRDARPQAGGRGLGQISKPSEP
jgi:peptidoglycan/LPS O-acetylase OafA/YrhL